MKKRYTSIWFRYLTTDWLTLRKPDLVNTAFVFAVPDHGRKVISAMNALAEAKGIRPGMAVADARAIFPELEVFDEKPGRNEKLLKGIAEWCIRFTPSVTIDLPDGLILDITGCTHLWGGEKEYLLDLLKKLREKGYTTRGAIADTVGAAWAIARFGKKTPIIKSNEQTEALLPLHPAALRLENETLQRLDKLGLQQISSIISLSRSALRRRFGENLLLRLAQAIGQEEEYITPIQLIEPYQERLPCLEPIRTSIGIEIAIRKLLEGLCLRLRNEGKGLRVAILRCYRVDGKVEQVEIGTNAPTHHIEHLFKLLQLKISNIEPALGIELFVMEAPKVEDLYASQEVFWASKSGMDEQELTELLDRISIKLGSYSIRRFLPDEHFWPERSIKPANSVQEPPAFEWRTDVRRPTLLLSRPYPIQVTAPLPDYPPILFRYQGKVHHIKKADGPERIDREWWLDNGEHRDYYQVEDENGQRYWLFRSGHYTEDGAEWFLHGFFA